MLVGVSKVLGGHDAEQVESLFRGRRTLARLCTTARLELPTVDVTMARALRDVIVTDLWRYSGRSDLTTFLRTLRSLPGFRYTVTLRAATWATALQSGLVSRILRGFAWRLHASVGRRAGMEIPIGVRVGPGLRLPTHPGGVVIHPKAELGANCVLSHGVTIGLTNRGAREGVPKIGDNVYIAPGAKIIGRVIVGSHAAVGANCVVTKDVPESGVVVGVPGKVISSSGSDGYINNVDWPPPACSRAWHATQERARELIGKE